MNTEIRAFDDVRGFRDRALAFLLAEESLHTLHLGILDRLENRAGRREPEPPVLLTVESAGQVVGFVMRTPPHKLLLSDLPPATVEAVVDHVHRHHPDLPTVLGPRPTAEAFAAAWSRRSGRPWRVGMEQALHRLDRLEPPAPVPGSPRVSDPDDVDLVLSWFRAFEREAHVNVASPGDAIRARTRSGDLLLWTLDGIPVSMAGCAARTPHGGRVGPVYTPPDRRGRGFGTAVTAALTRSLLDRGAAFVVLYTDLANPTSNKIYHGLGYRIVQEVVDLHLDR